MQLEELQPGVFKLAGKNRHVIIRRKEFQPQASRATQRPPKDVRWEADLRDSTGTIVRYLGLHPQKKTAVRIAKDALH